MKKILIHHLLECYYFNVNANKNIHDKNTIKNSNNKKICSTIL